MDFNPDPVAERQRASGLFSRRAGAAINEGTRIFTEYYWASPKQGCCYNVAPDGMNSSRGVTAIYPGSFDPITNGHLDVIKRCCSLFEKVIVAVLVNSAKIPLFSTEERVDMLRQVTASCSNVVVDIFDGLLVEHARRKGARVIVRGIRAVSDYEYEFQMALMNRRLDDKIETVFLVPAESYSYLSSRLVKEVFLLGGNVSGLVPALVEKALARKMKRSPNGRRTG